MTVTAARYGVLNSVPLDTYAWEVVQDGYDELLDCPALRGIDVIMPGARGRRAYPREIDATVVSIPLHIIGSLTEDGTPISDEIEGMLTHRDYLRNNLGMPEDADADRGTVPFVFVRGGSLADWEGEVTFLGLHGFTTLGGGEALVRIDLSIPDGELEEAES